jgi:hypothetical protein
MRNEQIRTHRSRHEPTRLLRSSPPATPRRSGSDWPYGRIQSRTSNAVRSVPKRRSTMTRLPRKFHRPGSIDRWLAAHREQQERVVEIMLDRSLSVDSIVKAMHALGCPTSRSAVARYRLRHYRERSGPKFGDRIKLMELLARLPDDKIATVIDSVRSILPSD